MPNKIDCKAVIEKIFKESESDKVGGMSAVSEFYEFYRKIDSVHIKEFDSCILNLLYTSNANDISRYSWLFSALASNGVLIPGVMEMLTSKLMELYAVAKKDDEQRRAISHLEKDLKIIKKHEH